MKVLDILKSVTKTVIFIFGCIFLVWILILATLFYPSDRFKQGSRINRKKYQPEDEDDYDDFDCSDEDL